MFLPPKARRLVDDAICDLRARPNDQVQHVSLVPKLAATPPLLKRCSQNVPAKMELLRFTPIAPVMVNFAQHVTMGGLVTNATRALTDLSVITATQNQCVLVRMGLLRRIPIAQPMMNFAQAVTMGGLVTNATHALMDLSVKTATQNQCAHAQMEMRRNILSAQPMVNCARVVTMDGPEISVTHARTDSSVTTVNQPPNHLQKVPYLIL